MEKQHDVAIIGAGSGDTSRQFERDSWCYRSRALNRILRPQRMANPVPAGRTQTWAASRLKHCLRRVTCTSRCYITLPSTALALGDATIDVNKMVDRKDGQVTKITKGIEYLLKKNKIDFIKARAKFVGMGDGTYELRPK